MVTRRQFLRRTSAVGATALATFNPDGLARLLEASAAVATQDPLEVARDEFYWREVQQAFTLDRSMINLNNGGVCPSPRVVHEAMKRYLDISNQAPAYHMWQIVEPGIENVRRMLAADAGVDPEHIAITRNASEALQIAQLGLDLKPGDEVLTTNQDYGRMLQTWDQRVARDGIRLTKISFPVPPAQADLVRRFEAAITPATRVIHFCHITNLTGHIFPAKEICALARSRGITTIVDGAHAYAHFPFDLSDFDCDYYGTSLHKWLLAPIGTGFLYVRPDRIANHWAMQPPPASLKDNIRKFEEIGTHPAATHNAIAEALTFHHGIGVERKAARLRYLKARWADRLTKIPRVQLHTSLDPKLSCAIGTVGFEGVKPGDITSRLWSKWRILATPIGHAEYQGVRITPNVYTTLEEVDTFGDAMETLAKEL
ncbi:MAG: aminotransferase class V-fold PLP-dependent enzyme [Vicinamibacterales bacterium]